MRSARTIFFRFRIRLLGALGIVSLVLLGYFLAWKPSTFALVKHRLDSATTAAEERDALVKAARWGRPWEVYLKDAANGRIAPNSSEHERLMNDPEIQIELDIEWLESSPFGGGPYRVSHRIIDKANIAHFYESQSP